MDLRTPAARLYRAVLLMSILAAVPVAVWADAGSSATIGKDHFAYGDVNADVDVSSTVNVGVYYAHYDDDFIQPTDIYSANVTLQHNGLYGTLDGYFSPETANYTFYGAQAVVGYRAGGRDLDTDGSVTYGRTLNLLYAQPGGGQRPLHENVLNPAINLVFRKTMAFRLSYAYYFHQEDPTAFFEEQFGNPQSLPPILLIVSGYPSREGSAGLTYYMNDNWQFALDLDRTLYEGLAVQLNTLTWTATCYPTTHWGISGSYALGNGALWYFSLGLQWYPAGHKRGEEKQTAISYNSIP